MAICLGKEIGVEICGALGINHEKVARLVIDIPAADIATVTISRYITCEEGTGIAKLIEEKYRLELKDGS